MCAMVEKLYMGPGLRLGYGHPTIIEGMTILHHWGYTVIQLLTMAHVQSPKKTYRWDMWPLLCRWNPQDVSCQIMKFQGPPRHTNALCAVQSVLPRTEPSQVNRPCTGPRWERACGQKRSKKQVLNYPSM